MAVDQRYWNPIIETIPREKIRQLQLNKFRRIFKWAYDHSKFHRQQYDAAGITPDDIQTFEDIRNTARILASIKMLELNISDLVELV